MNKLYVIAVLLALGACSRKRVGPAGDSGTPGNDGNNGLNSLIAVINSAPSCVAGGIIVLSGLDYNRDDALNSSEVASSSIVCNGVDGNTGATGENGYNAIVDLISEADGGGQMCAASGVTVVAGNDLDRDGLLQLEEITISKDICHGHDGAVGPSSPPTSFTVVSLEDPCGDAPGVYDEVLLRLANGQLIASMSDTAAGKNTRLAQLPPGAYGTTDADSCSFAVDANLNIVNESHQN